jgi:hypothetical protein
MGAAVQAGQVRYLSQTVDHFAHHESTWWVRSHEGWFEVAHPGLPRGLGAAAETLGTADAAVQSADHVTSNNSNDGNGWPLDGTAPMATLSRPLMVPCHIACRKGSKSAGRCDRPFSRGVSGLPRLHPRDEHLSIVPGQRVSEALLVMGRPALRLCTIGHVLCKCQRWQARVRIICGGCRCKASRGWVRGRRGQGRREGP